MPDYKYKNVAFQNAKNVTRKNDYNRLRQGYSSQQPERKPMPSRTMKEDNIGGVTVVYSVYPPKYSVTVSTNVSELKKANLEFSLAVEKNARHFLAITKMYPLSYVYDEQRYMVKSLLNSNDSRYKDEPGYPLYIYMKMHIDMEKVEEEYARLQKKIEHKEVLQAKRQALVKKFVHFKETVKGKWQALVHPKQKETPTEEVSM